MSLPRDLWPGQLAEQRERRKVPAWLFAQDLVSKPWEREALQQV